MSKYGAEYGRWAPFSGEEPEAAQPNYGPSISLGPLNQAQDNPSFATADSYGDNALKHHLSRFSRGQLDYTTTNMPLAAGAAVYGATLDEDSNEVSYGNDDPPYGGLAFFCELDDENSGKTVYRGVWYPKLKAQMTGEAFNTIGDNITFANDQVQFTIFRANFGPWKVEKDFETAAAAKTWVDGKLPAGGTPAGGGDDT